MSPRSLPASYFEQMYVESADPWGFGTRWYERRKYALTVAALPRRRYRSAFEPGCSVGVLTALLAARCDAILATDVADAALRTARTRLTDADPRCTIEFRRWALGSPWPQRTFDLIVLSEVGYYLDADGWRAALDSAARALESGGTLVCAHWRHPVADYPQTGDAVHDAVRGTTGLALTGTYVDTDFVLDVLAKTPPAPRSVAEAEGLV